MNRNIETKLIDQALRGDEIAFAEIYTRLRDSIYGFAFRMLMDETMAEDITQETFIFLIENPHKFDSSRGSLHPFLCGVTRNLVLHHLRKKQSLREDFGEFDEFIETKDETNLSPLEILLESELSDYVNVCVTDLPEAQREVIILRELQEFSYEEIAKITETDLNLVKVRLHRARKNLADKLAPYLKKKEKCNELR
ncbi:MAG: RNA polymerase sigma factor [Pyrinomonadaceae bacterium]|nr:RNA polymerase sigma factor [Pyrinomonadaceae bacterium]